MRDAQQILRARITALGRINDVGHRLFAAAVLEQQQPQIVRRLQMPLRCGLCVIDFGLARVLFHPATKTIGLAQVELRVGIALPSRSAPFGNGGLVIPALPRGDAIVDVRQRQPRQGQQCACKARPEAEFATVSRRHGVPRHCRSHVFTFRASGRWLTRDYHACEPLATQ